MSKGRKSYVKRRTETEIRVTENLSGGAVLTTKELLQCFISVVLFHFVLFNVQINSRSNRVYVKGSAEFFDKNTVHAKGM